MVKVLIERGDKRVFASALDWPGWARHARSEAEALEALLAYAPRYAKVAKRASQKFVAPRSASQFDIVERVGGDATTDYGAPSGKAGTDEARLGDGELAKTVALLKACWSSFDGAARAASGKTLRTGPRGGGRSVDKMREHVLEADGMYLSKLGSRTPKVTGAARTSAVRNAIVATLTARVKDEAIPDPSKTAKLWTPRFFARRAAWHALDHAWEIEDRSAR